MPQIAMLHAAPKPLGEGGLRDSRATARQAIPAIIIGKDSRKADAALAFN
ncbi:MAG TPA: hypothetical protein VN831_05970 [Bradyrhizobium sp.]|nr:hypothetical protein [Bradyrhizobium sp.]